MKKKKVVNLYSKGKKLNKFLLGFVQETARIKKVNVSTPARLKKFYNEYKDVFAIEFYNGKETLLKSVDNLTKEFNKGFNSGKRFIISIDNEEKEVTKEEALYEVSLVEQWLNNELGTTGFQIRYVWSLDGTIKINLPKRSSNSDILNMDSEENSEYLEEMYGIKIWESEPLTKDKNDKAIINQKRYRKGVKYRISTARAKIKTPKVKTKRRNNK